MRAIVLALLLLLVAGCSSGATPSPDGRPSETGPTSGPASGVPQIPLLEPEGIAVDDDGVLYISDCAAHRIYRVDPSGEVTPLGVGNGGLDNGLAGDGGSASKARFSCPAGLALDHAGNLFVDDHANNRIRMVDASGLVSTVAGSGPPGVDRGGYEGDGGLATEARLSEPIGVAFDARGDLFIADRDNHVVRMIDIHGVITTVAGTGKSGFSGDGDVAIKADLSDPEYIAVDSHGRVYFTDQLNERIRMIDTHGIITTVAGTGEAGYAGDGGPATAATLNEPYGLAVDTGGNIYVSDSSGARIQMIDTHGIITTVAGTGEAGYAGDGGPATEATLDEPYGLAVDATGNLYIADVGNGVVRMVEDGVITTVVAG